MPKTCGLVLLALLIGVAGCGGSAPAGPAATGSGNNRQQLQLAPDEADLVVNVTVGTTSLKSEPPAPVSGDLQTQAIITGTNSIQVTLTNSASALTASRVANFNTSTSLAMTFSKLRPVGTWTVQADAYTATGGGGSRIATAKKVKVTLTGGTTTNVTLTMSVVFPSGKLVF